MKKLILLAAFVALALGSAYAAPTKCEASINGYHIKTVYITGSDYAAVRWVYKHLSDATCMIPVTDPTNADAILELIPPSIGSKETSSGPLTVSCESGNGSSSCIDSDGNELDVDCDANGDCSTYYGPSVMEAAGALVDLWIRSSWYQATARLYTPDHKLIWQSDGTKGKHWYDMWIDKLRETTFPTTCRIPSGRGDARFRKWAIKKCDIEFPPRVSIDLKKNARIAAKNRKQGEEEQMKLNAEEAAAKQNPQKH